MEIELYIQKKKEFYSSLINFIESPDDFEIDFLAKCFTKHEIMQNEDEELQALKLLSNIFSNHHRAPYFLNKFEQIFECLLLFKDTKKISISEEDIYQIFKEDKRLLFLLFEKGYAFPDEFLLYYLQNNEKFNKLFLYLYPSIKSFIKEDRKKKIEEEIKNNYCKLEEFEEKCRVGENDSYICTLIREDSVVEFIKYVNQNKISLSSKISPSFFETNSFLIERNPSLIEYATFFGSIQIIRYLKYNKIPLTSSMWLYAVHSHNAELIHFLEENEVIPEKEYDESYFYRYQYIDDNPYEEVFKESIKCHHNDIADFVSNNFLNQTQTEDIESIIIDSYNFSYFPTNIEHILTRSNSQKGFSISKLCFSLKQITIPTSITTIGPSAFIRCSSLKQIIIPSSVTSIGENAFYGCSSLTQIIIPSSVTSIRESSFDGCSSLTQISIPSSVTSIEGSVFRRCSSLKQIVIPSSVTWIGCSAFERCSSLTQINIPSSVTSIRKHAFSMCSSLKQITIPSSVTSIEENVFKKCSSLAEVEIPSSVTSIAYSAFIECSSLIKIIIPSSVTSIGYSSFYGCSSLKHISIPTSVTSIGNYVFYGCSSLTEIEIPSSVTSIGDSAFRECTSLTQITIPSSVTSIKDYAFHGCSSLTQITIPSSVTSIGNYAFDGSCIKLQSKK